METLHGENEQSPLVVIRKMEEDDIQYGFLEVFDGWKPTGLTPEEAVKVFAARERSGLVYTAVAVLPHGEVLGTASLFIEPKFLRQGASCGHVDDVVVHRQCRHEGVGSGLLEHIVEVARASGIYKLTLSSRPELMPFYAKCGFNLTEVSMNKYLWNLSDPEQA